MDAEAAWGTLRYLCVRPVSRVRIVIAKRAVTAALGAGLIVSVVITAVTGGATRYGWRPVLHLNLATSSPGPGVVRLLGATAYVCLAMATVAAVAVALSSLVDRPVAPVVGCIVVVIGSHVADGAAALNAVDVLLPTHHWNAWTVLFGAPVSAAQVGAAVLSTAVWLTVPTAVAVCRMRARDVHS